MRLSTIQTIVSDIVNPCEDWNNFRGNVSCPGNILSDISRLEVLVGGKQAENNSPEITNEAADICRRLFQRGDMNIHTYRELIKELVENHRDAHGYYSD